MRNGKKVLALLLSSVMSISAVAPDGLWMQRQQVKAADKETEVTVSEENVNGSEYGLADKIQDGVILHCFDWKYTDIQAELPNIAKAGFTSVQTSPAQKGDGDVWYWLYQPQTFSVQPNALGNKEQLQSLCQEAEKYGIKIIVDVVANHTRSIGDDGLGGDCFHGDSGGIDYGNPNRYDITHKRIGMPDLNSESTTVQNKVKGYIQELKSIGVDGIRWDAAKHIGLPSESCNFWPAVTGEGLYNYGEILNGPMNGKGNNDQLMAEYTQYISVTDDEYGDGILKSIKSGRVPTSIGNYSERGVSKDKLVYWAESHDTYSNNGEYGKQTAYDSENHIDRSYALVAGQGKATSLYFSRPFEKNKQSIKAGVKGSDHFKSEEVAAVNHLHNNCIGEKDYYVTENNTAAVCRESGAVIVCGSGSGDISIKNGGGLTAPGTYTDEIAGGTFTVTADRITGKVGDTGIAVIYKASGSSGNNSGGNSGGGSDTTPTTVTPVTSTPQGGNSGSQQTGQQKIYFDNSSYNWSSVYAYIYTEESKLKAWPGTAMTKDAATGYYSIDVPAEYASGQVIFTESEATGTTNRYPADMAPGLKLEGKTKLFSTGNSFEVYTPTASSDKEEEDVVKPVTATPTTKVTETPKPTATAAGGTQTTPATTAPATPRPNNNTNNTNNTATPSPQQTSNVLRTAAPVDSTRKPTQTAQPTTTPSNNMNMNQGQQNGNQQTQAPTTTPAPTANATSSGAVTIKKLVITCSLSEDEKEALQVGDSAKLKALAYDAQGKSTTVSNLEWTSNNTSVAKVSDDGTVHFVGTGLAIIKVSYKNASGAVVSASMDFSVSAKKSGNGYLSKLQYSKGKLSPTFKQKVKYYRLTLNSSTRKVKLKPVKANSKAVVRINGKKKSTITLTLRRRQTKTVKIKVTAQNGSVTIYTVKVKRK